ncbi:MAG: hypothetical protein ACYDBQ_04790 [Thermoplasmatota archaeon]
MQEGIGRNGYRLLAAVFYGLGVLGLATTAFAFVQGHQGIYDALGFVLTALALTAVTTLVLVILARPQSAPVSFTRTESAPAPVAPPPLPPATPQNVQHVEFDEAIPSTGPPTVVAVRTPAVLPPNRNLAMDTKGWPSRRGPSGITRREMMEQLRGRAPEPEPEGEGPLVTARVPTILAKPAKGEEHPPGATRGQCGGCQAILLAPTTRPVNIRCPRCDKVTLIP